MSAPPKTNTEQVETYSVEAVNSKDNRSLYAARKKIFPRRVNGTYRNFKWLVMAMTLGVYYLTPWLRWDRGPHAPDQAVLVDFANARFYFFFIEIWPQEFFYVAGLLMMAGVGLFMITSTVGRAWCGYACPQTVWVDLFLVVERAIEGDRNARIKLDQAPMTTSKLTKRVVKHTTWLLIAIATGGAWIFYFADAPTLLIDFFTGQAAYVAYATVAILTATTYILGGLMREQVCTYMCPWPRIQAAMLDEYSLVVTYNDWRGEPRSRHAKKARAEGKPVGDCVDCNACVAVCPMGIDIRDGQQMECITCALCIDACASVMGKLGVEKGLIGYATLSEYDANMQLAGAKQVTSAGNTTWDTSALKLSEIRDDTGKLSDKFFHTNLRSFIRPRTLIYIAIFAALGIALLVALLTRQRLDLNIAHDRNPIFVKLSNGDIRNGYSLKIRNMKPQPRSFELSIKDLDSARMLRAGNTDTATQTLKISVKPDQLFEFKVFVRVPQAALKTAQTDFNFVVREIGGDEEVSRSAKFDSPNP